MPKTTRPGRLHANFIEKNLPLQEKIDSIELLERNFEPDIQQLQFLSNQRKRLQPVGSGLLNDPRLNNMLPRIRPIADNLASDLDGTGTTLAILDTGINEHNALKDKVVHRMDFSGKTSTIRDSVGHGTHIAGLVAASRLPMGNNMQGIAPGCKLVSVQITSKERDYAPLWRIVRGLEQVILYNSNLPAADKITAVLVCFNSGDNVALPRDTAHHRLHQLILELYNDNIPVICSTGNLYHLFRTNGVAYPAYIPKVIAVAALYNLVGGLGTHGSYTTTTQRLDAATSALSNFYAVAPGYLSLSTSNEDPHEYTKLTGSSQAAAIAAGTILLLQQEWRRSNNVNALPRIDNIAVRLYNRPFN